MLERKPLLWFLTIAFVISWPLFLIPLAFQENRTQVMVLCWSLGMWGPGIAAIVTTLFIEKKPFRALRLKTLGPKRFYLWAWLLPPALTLLTLGSTVLLGTGEFDSNLTMIRDALAKAPATPGLPPVEILVALQIVFAVTLAPFINALFALGEELGWRGYLLPKLLPLGQWPAILISGAVWGVWHAPAILQGHNFPRHPYLGMLLMIIGCILLGVILSWLTLNTRSPWVAALAHGSANAVPVLAIYFLLPGVDLAWGGSLFSVAGWVVMGLFIAWLMLTKRLPVPI
ncbi:MAG: CPBP family intramembrane metalloprotease, partial [Chloroflexi bacterium]